MKKTIIEPNNPFESETELTVRKIDLLPESHPILRKEPLHWSFDPPQADPEVMHHVMLENMVYHHGLGLSANQIGMPVKVFAMRVDDAGNAIVCFNPKITKVSDETVTMKEGCLSFPSLYLNIRRPQGVKAEYQNMDGDMISVSFEGLAARIFHHEMDHMKGATFISKVSKFFLQNARRKQRTLLRKARKDGSRIPY